MRALVYDRPGRKYASIREIDTPECSDGQVLIEVMSCGICKPAEKSHDQNGSVLGRYPAVPGHELAGRIVKTGRNVVSLREGMRVTVDNGVPCGTCYYCRRGESAFCEAFGSMGHNLQGGMAEYIAVDERNVYRIPDAVTYDQAALCELIGCCLRAVERSQVRYCDDVLVLGAGASGNILTQLFLNSCAQNTAVIDLVESKLKILKEKGALTYLAEPGKEAEILVETAAGFPKGFDIIVDACGSAEMSRASLKYLKKGGTFVGYSFPNGEQKELPLPIAQFIINEWTYVGSTFNSEFDKCIEIISGKKVDCDCLITGHYKLEEYFEALDESLEDKESIKVMIHPKGTAK